MKYKLLFSLLLFNCINSFSQNSFDRAIYIDSTGNTSTEANYDYIRVIKDFFMPKKDSYIIYEYYKSGPIKLKGISRNNIIMDYTICTSFYENGHKKNLRSISDLTFEGKEYEWYENGEKKSEKEILFDKEKKLNNIRVLQFWSNNNVQKVIDGNGQYDDDNDEESSKGEYINGYKNGIWTGIDKKNKITYTETYENGVLKSGESLDTNNIEHRYSVIDVKPEPKKGIEDFYRYIGKNVIIPNDEDFNSFSKRAYFGFTIDLDSKVSNVKVIQGARDDFDKNVVEVIKKYKEWNPGIKRGVNVTTDYTLPINTGPRY